MIIVLKPHPAPGVVEHVLERIAALGLTPHLSQGVSRTIIGVIGDESKLQVEPLQAIPGVEQVVPILKPFKLASREFHPEGSVFEVRGVKIGGGPPGGDRGPLCGRERAAPLRGRSAGAEGRRQHLARRRLQAPHQPLQFPGARARTGSRSSRRPANGSTCRS